jgi:hypothetical protein
MAAASFSPVSGTRWNEYMTGRKQNFRLSHWLCSLVVGFFCLYPQVVNAEHEFVINQFDGTTITGKVRSIDKQGLLTGTDLPPALKLADIVSLDSGKSAKRLPNFDATIHLIDGGKLFVREPKISAETVFFRTGCELAEVPLQSLRAIVWRDSPTIQRQTTNPSLDKDAVFVETPDGERGVEGIVEQLDNERLQINYQSESRKIGVAKINAIVMADLGLDPPPGPIAMVNMTDGSTVAGVISTLLDDTLSVELTGGFVELGVSMIASIAIPSDRQLFLSELEPLEVQQKTDFAVFRPWQKDRSVENNPLTIRYGTTEKVLEFNKGLGTQAFSLLVFKNSQGFDRFKAIVGIDAETQGRGDCQMVVLGDGIELWSRRIRGSDDPQEIDVDIEGINQISLVVYPGENFDLGDHANWGNARFVKTK